MAIKTTAAQLEEVQNAITKVLGGQSVTIGGMTINRSNLDMLHQREEMLLSRYKRENGTRSPFTKSEVI